MPSETRYFRSDTHLINGLTKYQLKTTNTASAVYKDKTSSDTGVTRWACDVAVRHADNTETALGTKIAEVSRSVDGGTSEQSANWTPPETILIATDAIIVRCYCKLGYGAWGLISEHITEQLGASLLNATQWTFVYNTWRNTSCVMVDWLICTTTGRLWFGSAALDTRIENFDWELVSEEAAEEVTVQIM